MMILFSCLNWVKVIKIDRANLKASPHEVLTHGQQQERESDGGDDCGADGEQHLHRVEEEEHDQ